MTGDIQRVWADMAGALSIEGMRVGRDPNAVFRELLRLTILFITLLPRPQLSSSAARARLQVRDIKDFCNPISHLPVGPISIWFDMWKEEIRAAPKISRVYTLTPECFLGPFMFKASARLLLGDPIRCYRLRAIARPLLEKIVMAGSDGTATIHEGHHLKWPLPWSFERTLWIADHQFHSLCEAEVIRAVDAGWTTETDAVECHDE